MTEPGEAMSSCEDPTSKVLVSPGKRRHPMTFFLYPGLEPPHLKGFLVKNQASRACIRKALDDLGRFTPAPSCENMQESHVDDDPDEIFLDDITEESLLNLLGDSSFNSKETDDSDAMTGSTQLETDDRSLKETGECVVEDAVSASSAERLSSAPEPGESQNKDSKQRLKRKHRLSRFFRSLFRNRRIKARFQKQKTVPTIIVTSCNDLQLCAKCGRVVDSNVHICVQD